MRWFKHLTYSWEDEKIASLTAEHGLEIYGFWWRLLEIIGKQMDSSDKTHCQYSPKVWGKFCGISAKKFQKFASFLEKKNLIITEFADCELKIDVPNMAKFRDEWSDRKNKEANKTRE